MKPRRIKLIWGASKVIQGSWYFGLFGFYDRAEGEREGGLAISLRGVMLWGMALVVAMYLIGTSVVVSIWRKNPYNQLGYTDALLYPLRRSEVREKKGRAFIAEGQDLIKAARWSEGAKLLRLGLTLFPGDLKGRISLARYNVIMNQREDALALLKDGLTAEYPGRAYIQSYIDVAGQGEDFETIIALVDRYYPSMQSNTVGLERRWLAAQKFSALLSARRADDALAWAEKNDLGTAANEQKVLALIELKRVPEAVDFLEQWSRQPDADLKIVRRLQVRALRDAGRGDDMEKAIEEFRALMPGDPRPATFGIVQRALAGRGESASAALDDFIFRYGGTPANLQMLAEPLAEIGATALFDRVMTAAVERGYPLQALRVLKVQLAVQQGAWAEATRELAKIKPDVGAKSANPREQLWYDWMTRLLAVIDARTDAPQTALVDFFRSRPWLLTLFKPTVDAMRLAGRVEVARDLVAMAEVSFPNSPWVQTQKREIAELLAPKKETSVVQKSESIYLREAEFLQSLTLLLQNKQWAEATNRMAEARRIRPRPEWLDRRDSDLRMAEVRIAQAQGQRLAMQAATRLYLNGNTDRSLTLIEQAEQFYAAGDKAGAITLVEEVLKRNPELAKAKTRLAEWKPTPGKK